MLLIPIKKWVSSAKMGKYASDTFYRMKKFGLIGHPIEHSLSPALFKAGYAGRYPYELIETPDFEEAYQRFLDGYDGINVTAPFKELAFSKADIISEECSLIGATNLLIKTPDGIKAHNSDFLGVRLWMSELSAHMSEEPSVLVVGLGGAGKAVAAAAWSNGFKMTLINRDIAKAQDMSARLGGISRGNEIRIRPLSDFPDAFLEADIIIYNLPVSIPEIECLCRMKDEDIRDRSSKHILEANYKNPSFNKAILDKLQQNGLNVEYHAGHTWLLLQAVTGYELFTGEKPDLSKMTEQI